MSASRSTISFTEQNWHKLEEEGNKSAVVNKALTFYFQATEKLKQREEQFILDELAHFEATQESYSYEETFNKPLHANPLPTSGVQVHQKGGSKSAR